MNDLNFGQNFRMIIGYARTSTADQIAGFEAYIPNVKQKIGL